MSHMIIYLCMSGGRLGHLQLPPSPVKLVDTVDNTPLCQLCYVAATLLHLTMPQKGNS